MENKHFYFFFNGKKFVFTSEIKTLKNFINEFNIQKLRNAILFSINDNEEYTIYKNVYNLQPLHYLEFNLKMELLIKDNKINLKKELFVDYKPNYNILLKKSNSNLEKPLKEVFSLNLSQLLRYEDRNLMRFFIENKTTFTDYKIIEFALNLPIIYKFKNGISKYFLRRFSKKFLPKKILFRIGKKGFETPEVEWLKNITIKNFFGSRINIYLKIKKLCFIRT